MPVIFPDRAPNLSCESLDLRQLDSSVLDAYEELVGDLEVARWTSTTQVFSRDQLLEWLSTRSTSPERLDWGIFEIDSGEFVGEIVLNEFDPATDTMNLRIALLPRHSSKGYGSQAVELVANYALTSLGLRRLELDVLSHNERAIRTYRKAGFTKHGELIEDGEVFDLMELRAEQ